jgi:hypothetical protein
VQRVDVIGVNRKRLPAAKLRVEVPASLHEPKPGLVECVRLGNAGALVGFSGVCPGFRAFHGQIFQET